MVALSALPRLLGKGLKSHFPPALFFFFLNGDQLVHTNACFFLHHLLRSGSLHSGSANWNAYFIQLDQQLYLRYSFHAPGTFRNAVWADIALKAPPRNNNNNKQTKQQQQQKTKQNNNYEKKNTQKTRHRQQCVYNYDRPSVISAVT